MAIPQKFVEVTVTLSIISLGISLTDLVPFPI
jgi:hypothetical protein